MTAPTDLCGAQHPDYPDVRCDRPALHNHHGGSHPDGVSRLLWLDSYLGADAPPARVQWGSRTAAGSVDWPSRRDAEQDVADRRRDGEQATLVCRTVIPAYTGPWKDADD